MGAAKAVAGNLSGGFFVSALRSWDGTVWGTQLCGFVLGKPPPEMALAAVGWIASRRGSSTLGRVGNHALLVTVAASLLPHGFKLLFDQTRPDRRTVLGHVHGVSFSGKRKDAFPSGHALHMGALASAAGSLPATPRRAIRTLAIGLSLTRVVVLAHWATDVAPALRWASCWSASCACEPAIRLGQSRKTKMPIVENIKEYP